MSSNESPGEHPTHPRPDPLAPPLKPAPAQTPNPTTGPITDLTPNPVPNPATDPPPTLTTDPADGQLSDAAQAMPPGPWQQLRRYTPARVALGRVGASLPTDEVLRFTMAHARARDAVHLPLDTNALALALAQHGFPTTLVRSQAATRSEYLRRPDLGRKLKIEDRDLLRHQPTPRRLTVVVADGLSSLAPAHHALPMLEALRVRLALHPGHWALDTVVLASQARVALGDEVGELRHAEAVAVLIGERPGLSSPDSLGIYLTYAPRAGRSDAERNCISNIRAAGLSYAEAAYKLHYLLDRTREAGASGILVKDASQWQAALPTPLETPRPEPVQERAVQERAMQQPATQERAIQDPLLQEQREASPRTPAAQHQAKPQF